MATPENQGGDTPIDPMGSGSRTGAQGTGQLRADVSILEKTVGVVKKLVTEFRNLRREADGAASAMNSALGGTASGRSGGRINVPNASDVHQRVMGSRMARSAGSPPGGLPGGGGGGGGGLGQSLTNFAQTGLQPVFDAANLASQRIGRGAEYALQADRMTVQLQQMYGMSNRDVRQQLRLPLTSHYLLGGGTAINDLLGMQATTGLTAAKQASTVEAFRTVSGFSLGSSDVTRMLSTMASPDVANRMFMMGGTGMYGIGGRERTGMQTVQDIVRRTGLTSPEALKGALQQGSNTRQRLTAMGVPPDMQDMVIQYAMQNVQFQRKTGDKGMMYDPSMEENRRVLGVEDTYALQHEKTTGERLKREERFYDKQTGAFSQFEKNLRLSTQMLGAFENALSGIVSLAIGVKGHPITNAGQYVAKQAYNQAMSTVQLGGDVLGAGAGALIPGDAGDGRTSGDAGDGIKPADERKLNTLDSKLAEPLRKMLAANPKLSIGDARRSIEQQERSFRDRYRPTNRSLDTKGENDRIWNGVLWEMKPGNSKPMAAPGNSFHEIGLAADVAGDDEWVRANAARYGLAHGGTTKGARSDEPFHVQPAGTLTMRRTSTPSAPSTNKGSGKVSSASAKMVPLKSTMGYTPSTSSASFTDAGAKAAEAEKAGLKAQFSPIIAGIDKPSRFTGDAGDGIMSATSSGGGGVNITVAPVIHLNGGSEMSGDLRRIAREVGKILEQEVSMVMARSR